MRTAYARRTTKAFLRQNLESEFNDVLRANQLRLPTIEGHILTTCRDRKKCKMSIPEGRKKGEEIEDRSPLGVRAPWM